MQVITSELAELVVCVACPEEFGEGKGVAVALVGCKGLAGICC